MFGGVDIPEGFRWPSGELTDNGLHFYLSMINTTPGLVCELDGKIFLAGNANLQLYDGGDPFLTISNDTDEGAFFDVSVSIKSSEFGIAFVNNSDETRSVGYFEAYNVSTDYYEIYENFVQLESISSGPFPTYTFDETWNVSLNVGDTEYNITSIDSGTFDQPEGYLYVITNAENGNETGEYDNCNILLTKLFTVAHTDAVLKFSATTTGATGLRAADAYAEYGVRVVGSAGSVVFVVYGAGSNAFQFESNIVIVGNGDHEIDLSAYDEILGGSISEIDIKIALNAGEYDALEGPDVCSMPISMDYIKLAVDIPFSVSSISTPISVGSQGATITGNYVVICNNTPIGLGSYSVGITAQTTKIPTISASIGVGSFGPDIVNYSGIITALSTPISVGSSGALSQKYQGIVRSVSTPIGLGSPDISIAAHETKISSLPASIGIGPNEIAYHNFDAPELTTGKAVVGLSTSIGLGSPGAQALAIQYMIDSVSTSIGLGSPGAEALAIQDVVDSVSTSIGLGSPGAQALAIQYMIDSVSTSIGLGSPGAQALAIQYMVDSVSTSIGLGSPGATVQDGIASVSTSIGFGSPGAEMLTLQHMINTICASIGVGSPGVESSNITINRDASLTIYKFIVTGGADGLSDAEIPITSFQINMYADKGGQLSVSIPDIDYADDIDDRSNGTLELWAVYTEFDFTELWRNRIIATGFDVISTHEGAIKSSVTVSGTESDAQKLDRVANVKTITLGDDWVNYRNVNDGSITLRLVKPHLTLTAGDSVINNSITFEVDRVTWIKSENTHHMELSES